VDEQATLLQGWQQDYVQLSAGAFEGRFVEARLARMHLFVEDTSRRLLQRGARPADRLALGLPLSLGRGPVSFCGHTDWQEPAREAHFCSFSGADGFEFMTPEGLSMAGLDLPLDELLALATEEDRPALRRLAAQAGLHRADPAGLRAAGAVERCPGTPHRPARTAGRRTGLHPVAAGPDVQCAGPAARQPGAHRPHRAAQLVARAQAFVRDDPETPHTVATLCQALGVSRRTLQAAFQQVTGLAPAAFLRTVRLAGARRPEGGPLGGRSRHPMGLLASGPVRPGLPGALRRTALADLAPPAWRPCGPALTAQRPQRVMRAMRSDWAMPSEQPSIHSRSSGEPASGVALLGRALRTPS
jgi:AraC family ethanolamine operon transcriptional activator